MKAEDVSRIRIRGYKSIKDCSLELHPVNVLIGSNGAGKSNFISAFSFLQSVIDGNLQLYAAQHGMNSLFYLGSKQTESIAMELHFGEMEGDKCYSFELIPSDDGRLIFQGEYIGTTEHGFQKHLISSGHTESAWKNQPEANEAGFVLATLKKVSWRTYHFNDTSRSARIKQEHNIANCEILMQDASNLAAFLYRLKQFYSKEYLDIIRCIRLVAPYFDDFILKPQESNPEQIVLRWRQKGCEEVFNASQLSDGTLRFTCLTTLLLQPEFLQPSIIIIDEPELGMHPFAITVLAEMIHQVSLRKQVIISTQSVEFLNEFDVEDIIVVESSDHGSAFKRLDVHELQSWLQEDYSIGDLWKMNLIGGF